MIRILKSKLQDALKGLAKVVGAKASIPVLGHVRLKAANGNVSVTGTNLEEWLTCEMDAETENDADWLLEFAKLKDFLKGDGKVFVGIEVAGDRTVKIAFDAGGHLVERIFETMPLDDWPLIPEQPKEMKPVSSKLFESIRLALPSASRDNTRKVLTGVFLENDAAVATDGKQIVKLFCEIPIEAPIIVPPTKVLATGMLREDGAMGISAGNYSSVMHISSGPWHYSFKCTEGTYPAYSQIIPAAKLIKSWAEFPAAEAQALMKSLPVFEKGDSLDGVALYAGKEGVKFLSTKKDSSAMIETSAKSTGSKEHGIAVFDRKYLLKAFSLGLTKIGFDWGHSPLLGTGDRGLLVFMPIRGMIPDEYYKRLGIEIKPIEEKKVMTTKTDTPVAPQNNAAVKPETQKVPMAVSTPKESFKVVHGAGNGNGNGNGTNGTPDPFEDLQKAVVELRNQAKALTDGINGLQRKIADAQRAVKQREKDFRSTREILDKLKNASGF